MNGVVDPEEEEEEEEEESEWYTVSERQYQTTLHCVTTRKNSRRVVFR
jgi:hypothetical protein